MGWAARAAAQPIGGLDLFVEVDQQIQAAVTSILAAYPKLVDVKSGGSGADPFVIALAQVNGWTVMTEERPRSMINPKIPDVCGALNIRCISTLGLIREQGWSYRL